jgi:peptide/nickel transport system ATP-binding protein
MEAMRLAALPEPNVRAQQYPHQLSGGLRQRVMIAIAIAAGLADLGLEMSALDKRQPGEVLCGPRLLVADEPTTALDVTVQKEILELLRKLRRDLGLGLFASLNPRMRVGEIVAEPLAIHQPNLSKPQRVEQAAAMLLRVGLDSDAAARYPHEFSGGQRQRIGIARALILHPKLVVADEPVSALDVSVGAQVLLLPQDLQREFALTYVFISHSLPVVAQIATRIAVMRSGKLVEIAAAEQLLREPTQQYTKDLLAAVREVAARH